MSKDVPRNRADSSCIGKIWIDKMFVAWYFKKDLISNNDVDDDKMMI